MTSLSDTLTVGFVLVLLFGSIALYLYTCIQQSEQKISLLESILLDLKMSAEFKSYTELPAEHEVVHVKPVVAAAKNDTESDHNAYVSFDDAAEAEQHCPRSGGTRTVVPALSKEVRVPCRLFGTGYRGREC